MDKLLDARNKIDKIDKEIMSLLQERYEISVEVGNIKKKLDTVVLDTNRENVILDKASKYSHSPQIKQVYKTIMNESKKLQRK